MPNLKITISTEADTVLDQFLLETDLGATSRGGDDISLANAVKSYLGENWIVTDIVDEEDEEAEGA